MRYDRHIDHDQVHLATIDDLHQNPVRRGLVQRAIDWEWSSTRWYHGEQGCHLDRDRTLLMLSEYQHRIWTDRIQGSVCRPRTNAVVNSRSS